MQALGPLDPLPLWGIYLITVAAILAAIECGYRLGAYRRRRSQVEDKPPVGEMVAATLALLAFILGFTFSLAGSWFDVRRRLVVDEANAIGTTYLRAGMLPEPHRSAVRDLLRDYVDVRLEGVNPGKLGEAVHRSEGLHARLWAEATAVGEAHPQSVVVGLFIWSLNEMIDLHTSRMAMGARTRLPRSIWVTLYFVAILGMGVIGYHSGLSGADRSLAMIALVLAFSAVLTLIADIDRPQEGLLRVSQQPLIDLQRTIRAPAGERSIAPPGASVPGSRRSGLSSGMGFHDSRPVPLPPSMRPRAAIAGPTEGIRRRNHQGPLASSVGTFADAEGLPRRSLRP